MIFFFFPNLALKEMLSAAHENIRGLEAQIDAVRGQIQTLNEQVIGLNHQLAAAHRSKAQLEMALARDSEGDTEDRGGVLTEANDETRQLPIRRRETNEAKVLRLAKEVLSTSEMPLDRHDLLHQFRKRGFSTTVVDPARFVGKVLWKSDDFIHDKREGQWSGYWLKSRPLPNVG